MTRLIRAVAVTALAAFGLAGTALVAPGEARLYAPQTPQELSPRFDAADIALPHRLPFWPSINWGKVADNADWLKDSPM